MKNLFHTKTDKGKEIERFYYLDIELDVKKEWTGKSLVELDLRRKYSVNVVAVRTGEAISTIVDPALPLGKEMRLIVIAETRKLQKLR